MLSYWLSIKMLKHVWIMHHILNHLVINYTELLINGTYDMNRNAYGEKAFSQDMY